MTTTRWTRVLDRSELSLDQPRTIKLDGKQIVLFCQAEPAPDGASSHDNGSNGARLDDHDGARNIQAIDNRCPHEGYPLSTGMLKEGILTCEWHNWKFRLCDGKCVLGGEDVRHYPLQVRDDGGIWLDLADPPAAARFPALYESLSDAFFEGAWPRAGRTIERLLSGGAEPHDILGFGCDWTATHAPYGFDHGLAVAADVAALIDQVERGDSHEIGALLLEAFEVMVMPNLRRPERALGAPGPADHALVASQDWPAVESELRRRIEDEELAASEGLLRAAVDAQVDSKQIFAWINNAVTDHFLGYGHAQIYCIKAEELLDAIGWHHAHPVLTSLISSIVYDTREDRLPYMKAYGQLVEPHLEHLERWAEHAIGAREGDAGDPAGRSDGALDPDSLIAAVVDGQLADALAAVADALDRGVAPDRIALTLGLAAAHRLLRFDARLEHDDAISEGWLHITHALTHADAVRESLLRHPGADGLRGLFHSARFVQHLAVCDAPPERRDALPPARSGDSPSTPAASSEAAQQLFAAIQERDAARAMAVTRSPVARDALEAAVRRAAVSDRATRPIFVAHHLKTPMAAIRLTRAAAADPDLGDHPERDLPLLASVRFLAHPLQERRVVRAAKVAHTFIREGKMQKKLLGY